MKRRLPFRYLEPTFFAGLLDDPLLLVNIRPLGRALLFDCGQLHYLAKRELRSISAIFISHAHMDHFMGMDAFIRHNHVSPRTIDIFGPPDISIRMQHKLQSYDWNLSEPYWCTFLVHEVHADELQTFVFAGAEGFTMRQEPSRPLDNGIIYENGWVSVAAVLCDHKIPSLVYRVRERESFGIDEKKLAAAGLAKGDWLRQLKKYFYSPDQDHGPLTVLKLKGAEIVPVVVHKVNELYASIRRREEPASIGYLTDVGFTEENLARMKQFLGGLTLLVCECSFTAEDEAKARQSHHLCTKDLNTLMNLLKPRFILPMHLSKSHLNSSHLIYDQLSALPGVTILKVADRLTPRPLIAEEVPKPVPVATESQG